ncbi:hypothetical protein KQX54_009468 [Cotesia glomerata]|uniref:Uncharacterized protein n=1 Tax=Cotesia glomerata TaxID=32391 RepID=A0AAV7HQM1_COTGL|nr:hypothetical protein KQX54_009468 [Cotesia glomerata]
MFGMTMVEPRERLVACPTSRTLQHHQSPQRQYHQVIKTTRIHHSSKNSRVVTVQEKVIRSRLQLGYSTPTNFINRGRSRQLDICWYEARASRNYLSNIIASPRLQDVDNQIQTQL